MRLLRRAYFQVYAAKIMRSGAYQPRGMHGRHSKSCSRLAELRGQIMAAT